MPWNNNFSFHRHFNTHSATACLLSSCGPGLRFWVDEPTKRVVRRPVGDDRALAACSTSLVRKASAGSPAGRRGDHLPLPVRDRLARRAQRFRSLADGVEAPPGLGCGRDLGSHPRRAAGPRRRERGAGLVGRGRLHDLPCAPARHQPRAHHRGRCGTTRICARSLLTTPSVAPAAGSRPRSISSSTATACPW